MRIKLRDKYICIEEIVIITLFICALSEKSRKFLNNYFTCYLFIVFHEMAHILVASILGYEVKRVNIRLSGLNAVFNDKISGLKGIVTYLAGPLSNIILAIFFKNVKIIFEINIALAIINIVPVKPLDGYNVLKLILGEFVSKEKMKNILNITRKTVEIFIIFLAIFMCFKYSNFSLFFLLVYIKTNSLQPLKSL